ncbi:cytochrome P450 [Flagelloscypha sp. PMI_526]|nr:cytochrome P450 [Flagelloscypha sp. PMI_526]
MSGIFSTLFGFCVSGLAWAFYVKIRTKNRSQLPPGPPGLPILGNLFDMPSDQEWKVFADWGRLYGGICSVTLFRQPIIIINDPIAAEQLDEKGATFSSRPRLEMGGELCKYAQSLVLAPYGSRWKAYRSLLAKIIGSPQANAKFASMEEFQTYSFLGRVMRDSLDLRRDLRNIVLSLQPLNRQSRTLRFVELIERANDNFATCCQPGHWLVDLAPTLMKSIPECLLPSGGFKAAAREYAQAFDEMMDVPFNFALKEIAQGRAPLCFISNMMAEDGMESSPDKIFNIKHAAGSMYGGGSDTTAYLNLAFFLAMILYPDVQTTAQKEIESVIGSDRLVRLSDRNDLPYVNAIVTELLRWHSVAPTGVPHLAVEDGFIGEYNVPKGALIITNLWSILHDEDLYPDPFTFDPTRHLSSPGRPPQKDPRIYCFGWSRRVCPGRHLADASLFLLVANSLATLNIQKAVIDGQEITPKHENSSGVVSHPLPFPCTITPRSAHSVELVTNACEERWET